MGLGNGLDKYIRADRLRHISYGMIKTNCAHRAILASATLHLVLSDWLYSSQKY